MHPACRHGWTSAPWSSHAMPSKASAAATQVHLPQKQIPGSLRVVDQQDSQFQTDLVLHASAVPAAVLPGGQRQVSRKHLTKASVPVVACVALWSPLWPCAVLHWLEMPAHGFYVDLPPRRRRKDDRLAEMDSMLSSCCPNRYAMLVACWGEHLCFHQTSLSPTLEQFSDSVACSGIIVRARYHWSHVSGGTGEIGHVYYGYHTDV